MERPSPQQPSLFQKREFISHSGEQLLWKIECDAMTDDDWQTLSFAVAQKKPYRMAIGVPSVNGSKFATALNRYGILNNLNLPILLVDDVLTTGRSMIQLLSDNFHLTDEGDQLKGLVVFARGPLPVWCSAIFHLSSWMR